MRGKFGIGVIESASWRVAPGAESSLRRRFEHRLFDAVARWGIRNSDFAIYTHETYRSQFPPARPELGHVFHASWIDAENVIGDEEVREDARRRMADSPETLCAVFAARLDEDKGVRVLLDAMKILDERGAKVRLDILGAGPLLKECEEAARAFRGSCRLRTLGVLPYGEKFFEKLRDSDVMAVPSISDEQPRAVYDAFSQGLPVIASDTDGLRACIQDRRNGRLVPCNDAEALAEALRWAEGNREDLEAMGIHAVKTAREMTHAALHRRRWAALEEAFAAWSGG
jgi:glycosyltransferase involved in cell wall biosynthesis